MGKIKEDRYTNEQGIEMIKEYFGKDKDNISAIVDKPALTEVKETEEEYEESISQDELNAEILLNQATIIAKQEEQDEVLAEILLKQMEV